MKFRIEGRELEAVENMRVGEVCEAEKALNVSADGGFGARTAVMLFIAMRKEDPEKPIRLLADEVMRADIGTVEEVEEESPPAEMGDDEEESPAPVNLPTSGHPLSVQ